MVEVIPRTSLKHGTEGYLEERKTGKVRKCRILSKGANSYLISFEDVEVYEYTRKLHKDYNKLAEEGWRIWNGKPPRGMRAMWEM